jgi:hypothetical protein
MPAITIRLDGILELMAGFEALPVMLDGEVEAAMVKSIHLVQAEVVGLTPRRTGHLASSWQANVKGFGGDVVGILATRVKYAPWVEENTDAHDIVAHGNALMIPVNGAAGVAGSGVGGQYGFSPFGGATLSGRLRAGQQFILRKKVRHPGTLGKHMARFGVGLAKPAVIAEFRAAVNRARDAAFSLGK